MALMKGNWSHGTCPYSVLPFSSWNCIWACSIRESRRDDRVLSLTLEDTSSSSYKYYAVQRSAMDVNILANKFCSYYIPRGNKTRNSRAPDPTNANNITRLHGPVCTSLIPSTDRKPEKRRGSTAALAEGTVWIQRDPQPRTNAQ